MNDILNWGGCTPGEAPDWEKGLDEQRRRQKEHVPESPEPIESPVKEPSKVEEPAEEVGV